MNYIYYIKNGFSVGALIGIIQTKIYVRFYVFKTVNSARGILSRLPSDAAASPSSHHFSHTSFSPIKKSQFPQRHYLQTLVSFSKQQTSATNQIVRGNIINRATCVCVLNISTHRSINSIKIPLPRPLLNNSLSSSSSPLLAFLTTSTLPERKKEPSVYI